ncbi:MAG: hypothetical protein A2Y69_10770 [Candidatus Aminicenantes bacterium RBG_13_59_9]|nr:MAG: hypothetical protein A2Y69_10770 [Candidatus Aminicenantes bacterium RBG_13_59_9]
MKKAGLILKGISGLAAALLLVSCNALVMDSQSATVLFVDSILGTDLEGQEADFLQSDVLYQDPETGSESIHADIAMVFFRAELLDPNSEMGPSIYNDIQVTRYVVTYSQPNGNSVEGRDVPYSFEGSMTAVVRAGDTREVSFVIVREVAKIDPPLVTLVDGSDVLEVIANVDFYGKDMAGKTVKASGKLTIFFANYVNE